MMRGVKASLAAECCDGKLYGPDVQIFRTWKVDSRDVAPGDAFAALRGENTDGHLYIHQAIERGAKVLLAELKEIEKLSLGNDEFMGITIIAVDDTVKSLAKIARRYLEEIAPRVIGITGSVGKTTTRELTLSVLKQKYKVHSAIRSFNTTIGCSLTILAMPPETEILILELGTNHFGEISEMVSLFPPEAAVVTEVAPAHLEGFGGIEGVLRAKLEICGADGLRHIVYNADNLPLNEALERGYSDISKVGVGYGEHSELQVINALILPDEAGVKVRVEYLRCGELLSFEAPLFGRQHAYNIGYAYLIGKYFSLTDEDISRGLAEFKPIAGRGICKKLPGNTWVIDEAYNANPSSMKAAIENVVSMASQGNYRMFAVLGGMKELGEASSMWHESIAAMTEGFDKVILLGDEWYDITLELPDSVKRYRKFEDITALIEQENISGGILLVKGSNSYGLKRVVALLTEGTNVY